MLSHEAFPLTPNWFEVSDYSEAQKRALIGDEPIFQPMYQSNYNAIATYLISEVGILPEHMESWFFSRSGLQDGVEIRPADIIMREDGFKRVLDIANQWHRNRQTVPVPSDAEEGTTINLRSKELESVQRATKVFEKVFTDNGLSPFFGKLVRATLVSKDDPVSTALTLKKGEGYHEYKASMSGEIYNSALYIMFVEGILGKTHLVTKMNSSGLQLNSSQPDGSMPQDELIVPSDFSLPPERGEIEFFAAHIKNLSSKDQLQLALKSPN